MCHAHWIINPAVKLTIFEARLPLTGGARIETARLCRKTKKGLELSISGDDLFDPISERSLCHHLRFYRTITPTDRRIINSLNFALMGEPFKG